MYGFIFVPPQLLVIMLVMMATVLMLTLAAVTTIPAITPGWSNARALLVVVGCDGRTRRTAESAAYDGTVAPTDATADRSTCATADRTTQNGACICRKSSATKAQTTQQNQIRYLFHALFLVMYRKLRPLSDARTSV